MDPIAIAPVAPPPPNEAQAPRETKEEEGCKKNEEFDKKLKKELSLLAPDAAASAADPAVDAALPGADVAATAADAGAKIDPAVAGLIADPALAAQAAAAAAAAQAAAAAASATARDAAGARAGKPGDTELAGVERAATERNVTDRGEIERDSVQRMKGDRDMKNRVASEFADAKRAGESVEKEKMALDAPVVAESPKGSMFGGTGGEHGGASHAMSQQSAQGGGLQLDGLSAASLVSKWSSGAQAVFDAAPAPTTARIDTPLGAAGWGEAFQQKIVWLADRQQQSAELHINPQHLGPVEIMLSMTDEGTKIAFCSPHAAVREAIEANMPDLRNAMDQRGLNLGQAMVSADSGTAREQFSQDTSAGGQGSGSRQSRGNPAAAVRNDIPRSIMVQRGLVDTFA